jgi:hypothetical protein
MGSVEGQGDAAQHEAAQQATPRRYAPTTHATDGLGVPGTRKAGRAARPGAAGADSGTCYHRALP